VDIANDVNSALQKVWLRTHEAHVATTAP
jgi:hypothetical protein